MTQEISIGQKAQNDIIIFSGLLNHFKWTNLNKKTSAWIYLSRAEISDGETVYRSVLAQVFGNTARMLEHKYNEMQRAKSQGQRTFSIIQLYSAAITSWTPKAIQGKPKPSPVVFVKGFKAAILDKDRIIEDFSERSIWDSPVSLNQTYNNVSSPFLKC